MIQLLPFSFRESALLLNWESKEIDSTCPRIIFSFFEACISFFDEFCLENTLVLSKYDRVKYASKSVKILTARSLSCHHGIIIMIIIVIVIMTPFCALFGVGCDHTCALYDILLIHLPPLEFKHHYLCALSHLLHWIPKQVLLSEVPRVSAGSLLHRVGACEARLSLT